jgi:hypothetical protein
MAALTSARTAAALRLGRSRLAQQKGGHGTSSRLVRLLIATSVLWPANLALAWVYPEHRDIALLAVEGLDSEHKTEFDQLWQDARTGDDNRLCVAGADVRQGLAPSCIDWAAFAAISGDHSCSSAEMLETVLWSDWILAVAGVGAQLKEQLSQIPVTAPVEQREQGATALSSARRRLADQASRAKRVNALRAADTQLQRADPQYATRAGENLAHFLLPRPDTKLDPVSYANIALSSGAPLNAIGVYTWYHISALQKASQLFGHQLPADERQALARAALADEAFALHFLEDMYAAGHVAGSWGSIAQRKGTHDYYNENGLEVFTWEGRDRTIILMGDAHMRSEDAALVADAVRTSLEQVLDAASGRPRAYRIPEIANVVAQPEDFDVCKTGVFPDRADRLGGGLPGYRAPLREVLLATPVPGLGPGLGAQPRARSEIGAFVGVAAAIEGRAIDGGFVASQTGVGAVGGLDLGARVGVGLEGALGDAGDGLLFMQIGFHADGASTNRFSSAGVGTVEGDLTAAVPARSGLSFRIRMPYYLIPGDLLLLSPMYFASPEKYTGLAVTASNGGLIGWQRGYATGIGRFQFVLGRELGVTWYGVEGSQQLLAPPERSGDPVRVIDIRSVYFDLPVIEYRPYRAFSANQGSSVNFQLFMGADVPYGESVQAPPGASRPDLRTVWSVGLRFVFDWRYYW